MASILPINVTLSRNQAAHLLRRTTFGPTINDIDQFTGISIDQALTTLLTPFTILPDPPLDPKTNLSWLPKPTEANSGDTDLIKVVNGWWLEQMRTNGTFIVEKMVFYFHTHFTSISSVIDSGTALYYQNQLFRTYALGNYKELAYKMCLDNAMLIFLDGKDNIAGRPQENFAREFLELFTIVKRTPNSIRRLY